MAFYQRLNPRLFVLAGVLALLFTVLVGGLAWQQLWKGSDYDRQERRQTLRRILQPGPRGRILDRNGVPLVVNQPHYSVVLYVDELRKEFSDKFDELRKDWLAHAEDDTTEAHPTIDKNKLYREARVAVAHRYLDQANALLGGSTVLDEKAFATHVEDKPLLPFILIPDISATDFARFNEEIPVESHMQTRVETRRYYPYKSLAFHTLGWVGMTSEYDEEDWPIEDLPKYSTFPYRGMIGKTGLEKLFDETLSGKPGGEIWVVDPANSRIERVAEKTPQAGQDVRCSLDVNLQLVAERALDKFPNVHGSAVALDVRTGEVLVLASKPDFDLNETTPTFSSKLSEELESSGGWLCRPLQAVYPPGSTFKLITTMAAMRAGILDGNTHLECPGEIPIGGREFKDDTFSTYPEGRGNIDVVRALQISNDVFYYQVGTMPGFDWKNLNAEARNFGLGQQTGIGLDEAPTRELLVPDPEIKKRRHNEGWNPGDNANFAVGQSDLQVTPMQMACLVASIARDETRTHPTLAHNPNLSSDTIIHGGTPIGLAPELRQVLINGMEKVVSNEEGSTGKFAQVPGIRIAGKTGTAQWGPHKDTTIAWFVCFAPIDNPRIAVVIANESPEWGADYYGGTKSCPIAQAILEEYFKRYPESAKPADTQTSANP